MLSFEGTTPYKYPQTGLSLHQASYKKTRLHLHPEARTHRGEEHHSPPGRFRKLSAKQAEARVLANLQHISGVGDGGGDDSGENATRHVGQQGLI